QVSLLLLACNRYRKELYTPTRVASRRCRAPQGLQRTGKLSETNPKSNLDQEKLRCQQGRKLRLVMITSLPGAALRARAGSRAGKPWSPQKPSRDALRRWVWDSEGSRTRRRGKRNGRVAGLLPFPGW